MDKSLIYVIGICVVVIGLVYYLDNLPAVDTQDTVSSGITNYSVVCIDGVEYLTRSSGYRGYMSVKFNRDGNVSLCDN